LDRRTAAERHFPHRGRTFRPETEREVVAVQQADRPRLRELRVARGWTQQDVADRLIRLAWTRKPRKNVGCTSDMVAKWERGAKGVSPFYRELLAKLNGVTIAQLGLDPGVDDEPTSSPTDRSLLSFLDTAAGLVDQLGAAGAVLQPQLFALWKDEIVNRRAMFTLLDPFAGAAATPAAVAPPDLDAIDQLADKYERLYDTADPAALLTPVAAHVRMVGDALRVQQSPGDRQRLLRNRVRVAALAGRLAFERNAMSARAFYSVAHDDAREVGDDTLRATVLGHTAQLAAAEGRHIAALGDLAIARDLVISDSPTGRWLARMALIAA
jgi:transcriptional regulator with XRE-family HTH domain